MQALRHKHKHPLKPLHRSQNRIGNLRQLFPTYTGNPNAGEALNIGEFSLLDNSRLCADFLSFASEQGKENTVFPADRNYENSVFSEGNNCFKFPSFEQWQRFLKSDHKAPKKPDREDPFLYPHPEYFGRDDLEARTYRAYRYVKAEKKWQEENHQAQQKAEKQRRTKAKYGNDKAGYCRYVFERLPEKDQAFLLQVQHFPLPEAERKKHTYLSGGTGSGKSECIKSLIHHYLTVDTSTALVLIDPHGKIAQEVAQFEENRNGERLVFIAPDFSPVASPVFNPFDVPEGITPQNLDIAVQELVGAFREILGDMSFTPQMETLLKPCIATLLLHPEGNLYQLQQMMDKEESKELLTYADTMLSNPAQKQFLKTDFLKPSYQPSRQSIRTKIQSLLNSQIFLNFVMGKSTFSLAEAVAEKKLIIFSLSRNTGAETSDTMGRLILASLQSLAMQRASLTGEALEQAPPIHVFIDECQHYITPSIETILTETRKYKLYLTLANQFLDQIDNRRIRNAIKGNTAVKITGRGRQTEPDTLANLAKITRADSEEIRQLKTGQYHIKAGTLESVKVSGNTALLDHSHSMKAEEWEQVRQSQLKKYYREVSGDWFLKSEEKVETEKTRKKGLN